MVGTTKCAEIRLSPGRGGPNVRNDSVEGYPVVLQHGYRKHVNIDGYAPAANSAGVGQSQLGCQEPNGVNGYLYSPGVFDISIISVTPL